VNALTFLGGSTFKWGSAVAAGSGTVYDVVRGDLHELPPGSSPSENCLRLGLAGTSTADPIMPEAGRGFWYLVRARNGCGSGIYGRRSDGTVITSAACGF